MGAQVAHKLSTRVKQGLVWPFRTKTKAVEGVSQEAFTVFASQLHGFGLKLREIEERLDALEHAHERLRGRFYAKSGPREGPQPQSKAEILREFGYMPGRPAPHK
jgi:hypothetical protein